MVSKEVYESELRKAWHDDEGMVKYCFKKSSVLVELSDGSIYSIDKPSIETRFCFGYGMQCQTDYDEAGEMADRAAESEKYFWSENVRRAGLTDWAEALDGARVVYISPEYYTQDDDCRLVSVGIADTEYGQMCMRHSKGREIGSDDVSLLAAAFEEAELKFEKRLRTYLKRYGLSKVETWTYWADE